VVDNQSAGGLLAAIDMETGRLGEALDGLPTRRSYINHPDHGAQIRDVCVPYWGAAVRLAESVVEAFPGIRFAGVDVAVSRDGPVVLELNPSPERTAPSIVEINAKGALADLETPK
jgi:hypothetical protein